MSVTISLTFDSGDPKAAVLSDVLEVIRHHGRLQPTATHAWTDNDTSTDDDVVHLVASEDPTGATSTVVAFIGKHQANSAHAWAEEHGGVIVELPIDTDCREAGAR